jgi:RHS repeat-associated protein
VQGAGTVPLDGAVPLAVGGTGVTVTASQGADTRSVHLEANLSRSSADGGTESPDGGASDASGYLTVKKVADPADSAEAVDATTGQPGGISFFKGWKVTVDSASSVSAVTNDHGAFSVPVFSYGDDQSALACTEVNAGTRWLMRKTTDAEGNPRIAYDPIRTGFPICAPVIGSVSPGSSSPVSLLVDMRLIAGAVRFVNKDGTPVGGVCDPDAATEWSSPGALAAISPDDVGTTEIHFFRDDNLAEPIARYSLAVPGYAYDPESGGYVSQFCDGSLNAHARYARLRMGPSERWTKRTRQECQQAEQAGQTGTDWYNWQCNGQSRINGLRLSAGDRLVIVAVNHATGYAGVSTVTVPPVTQGQGLVDGHCQADDEAGGPEHFWDFGQELTISRCATEDIRINANLFLYPPELDIRVARQVQDDEAGVQADRTRKAHLIRHGGSATSHDDFIQVATHWRVRKPACDAIVSGSGCCDGATCYAAAGGTDGGAGGGADGGTDGGAPAPDGGVDGGEAGPVVDWRDGGTTDGGAADGGNGAPGQLLEVYCSQLSKTASPELLARCAETDRRLVDMPAGVPPIYGQVVRVTGSSVEQPSVAIFPVRPGQNTGNVQSAFRYIDPSGGAKNIQNLPRANYYLNVVGNQVFFADDGNGILDPGEVRTPPPALKQFKPTGPAGVLEKALPLKDVYRSYEPDGTLVERFDRALEHEFRVLDIGNEKREITAQQGTGQRRVDQPASGESPSAKEDDVSYHMLLSLLAPDDAGRAGTLSGSYGVRLGGDAYGIDCKVSVDAQAHALTADCGGEYLYDVLAASDIVYFELFLSGNAENVLYRYNFYGLSPRQDLVTAGHAYTSQVAVRQDAKEGSSWVPATDRPISQPAMAAFFIGPDDFKNGTVRLCLDERCSGDDSLLKQVDFALQPDGSYKLTDANTGRDPSPMQEPGVLGLNQAQQILVSLTPDLAKMPGAESVARDIYLVKTSTDDAAPPPRTLKLGRPVGGFAGANARAPGQAEVGGVNLADGHLSIRHQDFSVPEFASRVGFSRTYNNQDNEVGTLGIGWRHNYESYVLEETVGRYAMVLAGQSYDFPQCSQVDLEKKTAAGCATDHAHGGSLTVSARADGSPDVLFQAANGDRYRFDRPSKKARKSVGRRRWVLTAFEDGHGRPDPTDASKLGPGWILVEYYQDSDMIRSVARQGGKLKLAFDYYPSIDDSSTLPRRLKSMARTENFGLLKTVTLAFLDPQPAGKTIGTLTFMQDERGNLKTAEWVVPGLPPSQKWQYTYETPDTSLSGADAWAQSNELKTAELLVGGAVQERTRWARASGWSGFKHERKFEVASTAVLPGTSKVAADGTLAEVPLTIEYLDDTNRKVTRPDGVVVSVALNEYGNVKTQTVGGATTSADWFSDVRGGKVAASGRTSPVGRALGYDVDDKLRPKVVKLNASSPADVRPVAGVSPGQNLATYDPDPTFGSSRSTTRPTASGKFATFATPLDQGTGNDLGRPTGDPLGVTVTDLDYGSLFSWTTEKFDAEGVALTESDAVGRKIAHAGPNAWGLMETSTLTLSDVAAGGRGTVARTTLYDALGRVSEARDDAGHVEKWKYDGAGRLEQHYLEGEPATDWHYSYQQDGDLSVTVTETLTGTAHQRVRVFRDGLLWKETHRYGDNRPLSDGQRTPAATAERVMEYTGGRLTRSMDERGVVRVPHYDARGRMDYVDATAAGETSAVREVHYLLDDEGKVLEETDADGLVTKVGYDQLGRASRWDYGSGDVEEAVLDANGVASQRKYGSHTISTTPDALGRVRSVTSISGTGLATTVDYDALGRKTHVLDGETGLEEWFEYKDVLGRVTTRKRKVLSGSAQLQSVETRGYQDVAGSGGAAAMHEVKIDATIGTGSGERTTSQKMKLDGVGRVLEVDQKVLGEAGSTDGRRVYRYDPRGNVITEQRSTTASETLATWTQSYDAMGSLVAGTDPGGATTSYVTDGAGLMTEKAGPHPQEHWTYKYDAVGQVLEKKLLASTANTEAKWSYEYRLGDGTTVAETDPLGYVTSRKYNARQKLLSEVRKDAGTARTSSNVQTTTYQYDGRWVSQKTVTEGNATTVFERTSIDDRGRTLAEGERWSGGGKSYSYTRASPWSGRVAEGVTETWSAGGRTETRTSRVEVDSLGNVVARTQGGLSDAWVYDAAGKVASATAAGKPSTVYGYEEELLVSTQYGDEPSTAYRYWPSGRLESVTDPSGRKRSYQWYDRGLLKTEEYGRGTDTELRSYTYDDGGYVAAKTVGRGTDPQTWNYRHGPRGELLTVTQPGGLGEFQYGYDERGQLASVQPPAGGMPGQTFGYDYLGRPVLRTRGPASWMTSWSEGTSTTVDPNGDTVVSRFDGRGRAASVSWQPGVASSAYTDLTAVEKTYDGLDQLLTAKESRGSGDVTTTYTYDGRSRVTGVSRGSQAVVGYGYVSGMDELGWVESSTGRVSYGYDRKGRLSTVDSPRGTTVQVGWEVGGERLLSAADGILNECRSYDNRGRLSYVANLPGDSDCASSVTVPYSRYDYGYDERGNRTSELYSGQEVTGDPTSYAYDAADRLVGVGYPDQSAVLYRVAGDGTRSCEKRILGYAGPLTVDACDPAGATESLVYGYDERGGLKSIADGANGQQVGQFETDAGGRLKSEMRGAFQRAYGWDAGGRLAQVTVTQPVAGAGTGTSTTQYGYDFAARRVSRTDSAGAVTTYAWGVDELVEERLPGGTVRYEQGAGLALAAGNERLLHDGLGSAVGRIGNGVPTLYRFDAWGGYRGGVPTVTEPSAGYAGQHWDADAGLSYAQQRWYDPRTGRFLSEDSVFGDIQRPNSLHAFAYANGNPVSFSDPAGTQVPALNPSIGPGPAPKVPPGIRIPPANEPMGEPGARAGWYYLLYKAVEPANTERHDCENKPTYREARECFANLPRWTPPQQPGRSPAHPPLNRRGSSKTRKRTPR